MRRIQVMTILGLAATLGNMMPGFAGEDNPPSQAGLQEQLRALEKRVQILERLLNDSPGFPPSLTITGVPFGLLAEHVVTSQESE
jgi:hypothetical protein